MKLYFKPGACSMAAHIVLREIGADFELEKTDTETGVTETGADFSEVNPNGYVPALKLDSGEVITENPAVLQYLADLKPEAHLAPAPDTFERVRTQELLNFVSSELHKSFGPFFSGRDLTPAQREAAGQGIARRIAHIERCLSDGRTYLTGAAFTVADAYAFVVVNWSNFIGFDLDNWPLTKDFLERVKSRPSVTKAMIAEGLIEGKTAA